MSFLVISFTFPCYYPAFCSPSYRSKSYSGPFSILCMFQSYYCLQIFIFLIIWLTVVCLVSSFPLNSSWNFSFEILPECLPLTIPISHNMSWESQMQNKTIPLLHIHPKEAQSYPKDICATIFIAALFLIARNWKQIRCHSIEEWIKKMWYKIEDYLAVKIWHHEICKQVDATRKKIKLSEVIKTQRAQYCMYSLISGY